MVNKFWWYVQRYRLNTGVWRTDGQTSCDCIVRAMHTRRTVKTAGGRMPLPPVYLCNGLASPVVCTVKFVTSLVTWQHHRCDVDSNSLSHPVLTVQFLPNCNKFVCWWYCDYLPKFHRSQFLHYSREAKHTNVGTGHRDNVTGPWLGGLGGL